MVRADDVMYRLRPVVDIPPPASSTSPMYRMKRIVGDVKTSSLDRRESTLPSTEELANEDEMIRNLSAEEREAVNSFRNNQLQLLKTLEDLKIEVEILKKEMGADKLPQEVLKAIVASLAPATSSSSSSTTLDDAVVRDIVVSAHPDRPPLAVLVYVEMLRRKFRLTGSVHIHSSVSKVTRSLTDAFGLNGGAISDAGIAGGVASRAAFQIAFTLIWKDVAGGAEMMISPHRQAMVRGEAAICRYLARVFGATYESEDALRVTEIDAWTDAARCTSEKEYSSLLKSLSGRLTASRKWLVGDDLSLADVLNWALVRSGSFGAAALPANVESWCQRCESRPEFLLAFRVSSARSKKR